MAAGRKRYCAPHRRLLDEYYFGRWRLSLDRRLDERPSHPRRPVRGEAHDTFIICSPTTLPVIRRAFFLTCNRNSIRILTNMKLATTPEEQRRWMEQWRLAAVALEEMKRYELQTLTDEEAWRQIEAIQSISEIWRDPDAPPGLVAQQVFFQKLR